MFTTHNASLIGVKMRQTVKPLSRTGQPVYDEFRFDETSVEVVPVWVDFSVARKMQIAGRDTEVAAVWEIRQWVQEQIVKKCGRVAQTGDLVQFSLFSLPLGADIEPKQISEGVWFVMGEGQHDAGLFGSIGMQKFNLIQSHRS